MKTKRLLKTIILGLALCLLVLTLAVPTFATSEQFLFTSPTPFYTKGDVLTPLNPSIFNTNGELTEVTNSYEFRIDNPPVEYDLYVEMPYGFILGSYHTERSIPRITVNLGTTIDFSASYTVVDVYNDNPTTAEEPQVYSVNTHHTFGEGQTFSLVDLKDTSASGNIALTDTCIIIDYRATFHISSNGDEAYNPFDVSYRCYADDLTTYYFNEILSLFYSNAYDYGISKGALLTFDEAYNEGYSDGYNNSLSNLDASSWLVTAVGGFLDFELFPGFSLGGALAVIAAIGLALVFLKFFAGG